MISIEQVREALYKKYIEPTRRERGEYIGVEIELPIVNLNRLPVDFDLVHRVTDRFLEQFGFEVSGRDSDGHIYAAEHPDTGDILSYDCSYNNLELSFGKCRTIHEVNARFRRYIHFLQDAFGSEQHILTGMGINPFRQYNHNVPIPNERYRMLFHHLASYDRYQHLPMHFHSYPAYGTFSSASQVQLDVAYDDLIPTIRAFSKLEPLKAVLFSNSLLLDEHEELLCARDMFWRNSTHGINPHNVGMFDAIPETQEELEAYLETESIYCAMRDGKYINFAPKNILEYMQADSVTGEYYEDGGYHDITFRPELSDLEYLRTFKFEDLTFRGTIEYRSVCCQPVRDAMTVAAFHEGLSHCIPELDALLEMDHVLYHRGYTAAELRELFVHRKHPAWVDEDALYDLLKQVVDLAAKGLKQRAFGEEVYLDPLYRRIETRRNPAEYLLAEKEAGIRLEDVIREYAALD